MRAKFVVLYAMLVVFASVVVFVLVFRAREIDQYFDEAGSEAVSYRHAAI